MSDMINPDHYKNERKFEPIEVIEDWGLNYRLGNAVKYISRNGRKPGEDPVEGLRKAIWYLEREIKATQKNATNSFPCSYEEVLEEHVASSSVGSSFYTSLDEAYDYWLELDQEKSLWDPTLGPVEPDDQVENSSCEIDLHELHKDLDQFEESEIIATFERRGLIFGIDKQGKSFVLGLESITT